jgi:hypothetical protein
MNLAGIQYLFTHDGPFVSLHLDVSRDHDAGGRGIESTWTNVRHQLEHAGVDQDQVARLGELVLRPTGVPSPARRTIVASGERVVFDDERMGHGAWPEVVSTGPLPDVSGWVVQVDGEFPFVLAVVDREGADIDVYTSLSQPQHEHETVQGETLHIKKVPSGDWAELQHHTEEIWRRNARAVGESVQSAAKEHGARLVIVAGEVRARAEVMGVLQSHGELDAVEIEGGGRAPGSSQESLWGDVNTAVGQRWQQDRQHLLERLEEQSAKDGAAAQGLGNVLEALVRGQVDHLIVDLATAREQTVTPADHPGLPMPASAVDARDLPAHQVLIAAAAATDANLTVLPISNIGGGVAALLRWEDEPS